jgi:hypothetical protein
MATTKAAGIVCFLSWAKENWNGYSHEFLFKWIFCGEAQVPQVPPSPSRPQQEKVLRDHTLSKRQGCFPLMSGTHWKEPCLLSILVLDIPERKL